MSPISQRGCSNPTPAVLGTASRSTGMPKEPMNCSQRGKALPCRVDLDSTCAVGAAGQLDSHSFPAVPRCASGAQAPLKKFPHRVWVGKLIIFMLIAESESWFPLHQDSCYQTRGAQGTQRRRHTTKANAFQNLEACCRCQYVKEFVINNP